MDWGAWILAAPDVAGAYTYTLYNVFSVGDTKRAFAWFETSTRVEVADEDDEIVVC